MTKVPTILFVEAGTLGGGSFVSLSLLSRALDRNRFRPVVALLNGQAVVEELVSQGIQAHLLSDPIYSGPSSGGWRARVHAVSERRTGGGFIRATALLHAPTIAALVRIARRERVALLHLNNQPNRDLFGLHAARLAGLPCISHLRSQRSGQFGPRRARFANRVATAFVANSESTRGYWAALGLDGARIHVVHNAVGDLASPPLDVRREWPAIPAGVPVLTCVGNLVEAKGHRFLLEAFARLVARQPAHLILVGDGPLRADLERTAGRLGLASRVTWAGWRPDARAILAGCDLAVVPSKSEGFSRVALEALYAGVPLVATRVGGIPEVVEHDSTGLLVGHGDEAGLVEAVLRLLGDRELAARLAAEGAREARERFGIARHAARIQAIYEEVLCGA